MMTFRDKVVLITGGTTGIGQATALAFAREGAQVVITGRRVEEGRKTLALLLEVGSDAMYVQTDVSQANELESLLGQIVSRYGRLDIAFNNAGIFTSGRLVEASEEDWQMLMDVNLKGAWLSMKYEIQQMLTQGGGVIVNMLSNIGAPLGRANMSLYAASKGGALALMRSAALEYIRDGIRINAISPGPIRTTMSKRPDESDEERTERVAMSLPIGRIGEPEEIAQAVLWLSSPASSFVVGHDVPLDGGFGIQ